MSDAVKKAREEMIKKRFGGNKAGAATGGSGSARQKAKGKGGKTGQPFVPVADRKCYVCGKAGHLAANCPDKAAMAAAEKK